MYYEMIGFHGEHQSELKKKDEVRHRQWEKLHQERNMLESQVKVLLSEVLRLKGGTQAASNT